MCRVAEAQPRGSWCRGGPCGVHPDLTEERLAGSLEVPSEQLWSQAVGAADQGVFWVESDQGTQLDCTAIPTSLKGHTEEASVSSVFAH